MDGMLFPKMGFALAVSPAIRHVLIRGSILLVAVAVLGFLIARIRRWRTAEVGRSGKPWTLQDLRDLHASGELTDEEFNRLKAAMIAELKASVSEPELERPAADDANG